MTVHGEVKVDIEISEGLRMLVADIVCPVISEMDMEKYNVTLDISRRQIKMGSLKFAVEKDVHNVLTWKIYKFRC